MDRLSLSCIEKGFCCRTLEFWRAIIAECIATFFYVAMICSVHSATTDSDTMAAVQVYTALGTGLAMITLYHAFSPVSGGHFNPAITLAMMITKRISMLRAALYVCAQCGGAIAGSALVYGIYGARDQFQNVAVSNFGLEFILTFIVVFVFFSANSPGRKAGIDPAVTIGLSYMAALTCYKGALNPARALGPAFVANKFELHWVFWVGPILGGICGAFCFQFIFNVHKPRAIKDIENVSVRSEDDMIDDMERAKQYRSSMIQQNYNERAGSQSLYNSSITKQYKRPMDMDSVYGGTKSLYNGQAGADLGRRTPGFDCSKSVYAGDLEEYHKRPQGPPLRTSLKRSQSSHNKSGLRRPDDPLPYTHEKLSARPPRHESYNRSESYPSDPQYSEYIRRKNAAADQCSGSSSGYYSSGKEAEMERRVAGEAVYGDRGDISFDKEKVIGAGGTLGRARTRSVSREVEQQYSGSHRRDRSLGPGYTGGTLRRDRSRDRPGPHPHPQVTGY